MTNLSNAIVWMVSARLSISNSTSSFTKSLGVISSAPITTSIMFYSFLKFCSKIKVLGSLFVFLPFQSELHRNGKVHYSAGSLLFYLIHLFSLIITRSALLAGIWWSVCFSKTRELCVPLVCVYTICSYGHILILDTIPSISPYPPSRVLYSFCASLFYPLIVWLIVSSLSLHNLHLLFCCVLSIFALTELVLLTLFCAAIRRESISLLKFLS